MKSLYKQSGVEWYSPKENKLNLMQVLPRHPAQLRAVRVFAHYFFGTIRSQ